MIRFSKKFFTRQKKDLKKADPQGEFISRLAIAFIIVILCFCILAGRFYLLQVIRHQDLITQSENNRISLIPTPPNRGTIIDTNGTVLAHNYYAYSLEINLSEAGGNKGLKDTLEKLKPFVEISSGDIRRFENFRRDARAFENIPLKLKLSEEEAARLGANLYQFPGVTIQTRSFRSYPFGEIGAHFIGYIGRISQKDEERLKENNLATLYRGTSHIGKMGLESYYEKQLHGEPGFEGVEKNANGAIIRVLHRTEPKDGQTLRLSLDLNLQKEVDRLFGNRRGALVAINPKTGGVLAFVSKPSFDPNFFIDGIDTETWNALNTDWQTPMVNRALRGLYPPGSIFKPFIGMAALESGALTQTSAINSPGSVKLCGREWRSPSRGHGTIPLSTAIQVSSDTFFYQLAYNRMEIDRFSAALKEFRLGELTGIDLDNEAKGIRPSREWKQARFPGKEGEWNRCDIISASIGQGYNAYTPLQMANATAIIANKGVAFKPHLVNEIIDNQTGQITKIDPQPDHIVPYSKSDFEYIKNAMVRVTRAGTAAKLFGGTSYAVAGKTGTAQVTGIAQGARYNKHALREAHRDHSWFIAFAPADDPQIAIAVIVENGGWGASAAGPLARQTLDYYLLPRLRAPNPSNAQTPVTTSSTPVSHESQ